MTWLQRYRLRYYVQNSIVVLPVLGIVAAVLTAALLHSVERRMGWHSDLSAEAVRTVIVTFAAAMLTFIVFLSSTLLLAVQLASAQLTPRIIAFAMICSGRDDRVVDGPSSSKLSPLGQIQSVDVELKRCR